MSKYRPSKIQVAARERYYAAAAGAGFSREAAGSYWLSEARKFENRKRRASSLFNEMAEKFEKRGADAGQAIYKVFG